MKVRIGIGAGRFGATGDELAAFVDDMDHFGFDSLWLPERLTDSALDPIVALAWAGAHHPRLKLGTTMLLPGRHPLRLAKQVATLDALSGGRLLLTFVPGIAQGAERDAIGVAPADRGRAIDEMFPILRALWAGETVAYDGEFGSFSETTIAPLPVQQPIDVWLGGIAPASLVRCGKLADGWLPALCTPLEAERGRQVIEQAAADAGRSIDPEHFGVSLGYATGPIDERVAANLAVRAKGRPIEELVPVGYDQLRELLGAFIAVGFSKFVLRPLASAAGWHDELESLAGSVLDLQT
jgi:probable F420-dependent oxidoreductase